MKDDFVKEMCCSSKKQKTKKNNTNMYFYTFLCMPPASLTGAAVRGGAIWRQGRKSRHAVDILQMFSRAVLCVPI